MEKPVRVLQVVTHMERGGLETMLMNYYRHMDRSKVQFDFLVHRQQRAAYDDEIEALGGIIHRLPRLVPWSVSYRRALNAFFADHPEYRIVHVHQDCLSAVILKAAKNNGVPVRIGHSHSSSQDKDLKYPIKLLYKRLIPRFATDLFACGEKAGDWMFGTARYHVIKNAIDAAAYSYHAPTAQRVRSELGIEADAWVVGHVGRFSYPKNHKFLVEIFGHLHQKEPKARLLLVGDGDLRSQTEEAVRALGLEHAVIFTGIRSDVPVLMQAMDLFLFPSLYEGVPLTMIEAQAAGLPCCISDRVPIECKLTESVCQISLKQTAAQWAEEIIAAADSCRGDTLEMIRNAGYDINSNAHWLQNYYLGAGQ